ncbi:hypothetical protein, partial [uncultured Pseudoflavonifractor sp.]|uniref:hypothetical protein n=1 Tax=uncultured Pseudoflavonifractor sp. TaxID=1221379 RepID=UPI0025F17D15
MDRSSIHRDYFILFPLPERVRKKGSDPVPLNRVAQLVEKPPRRGSLAEFRHPQMTESNENP